MRNLSILLACALGACATSSPDPASSPPPAERAPPPPAAPPPAAGDVVGPPQVAWKEMTKEQKGKFMKSVVVPKMKPLFTSFDAEFFPKVDCATCHGKDAKARGFKMPNPELYVLPGTPAEFAEVAQKKPKWVKFMAETVKPQMAALLGLPEFDPKNAQPGTMGCHNCHTVKGH
jgi:hypothetical protein